MLIRKFHTGWFKILLLRESETEIHLSIKSRWVLQVTPFGVCFFSTVVRLLVVGVRNREKTRQSKGL